MYMNWSILASVMDTFSPQSENSWFFSSITGPIHIQTDTGFMTLQALHRQIVYLAFMSPLWQATYSHTRYLHTSLDPLNLVCPYWGKENTAWLVTFISPWPLVLYHFMSPVWQAKYCTVCLVTFLTPWPLALSIYCLFAPIVASRTQSDWLPSYLPGPWLSLPSVCLLCGNQDTVGLVTFIPPWSLTLSA